MLVATCAVLVAIGVVLGVIEAFLVPQRLFGGVEGLSAALALLGNALVGSFAGIGTRSTTGPVCFLAGWIVSLGVLIVYAPGGDVIIPGALPSDPGVVDAGMAYLILGIFGGGIALLVTSRYTKRVDPPTASV